LLKLAVDYFTEAAASVVSIVAMPLTKYTMIHELLELYEIPFGFSYKTRESAPNVLHYLCSRVLAAQFQCVISTVKFFSLLMDGSVDKGKVKNEVIFV